MHFGEEVVRRRDEVKGEKRREGGKRRKDGRKRWRTYGEGEVMPLPDPHSSDGVVVVGAKDAHAAESVLAHPVQSLEHACVGVCVFVRVSG